METKLLKVADVAKRLGLSIGYTQILMTEKDFPPPREYARYGRKFYAAEDIDLWQATRKRKR